MASSNGAPAFKAVPFKAAAAAHSHFPVPIYLVMRTDWRFSKRSGRHQHQTTTALTAFTSLQRAQEAAALAFDKFVAEYQYAGEKSVENRFSWYSWWNGRNKAHYRDVKDIAETMKKWPSMWKGLTPELRYERMVEAMGGVKLRLPNGSVFTVEKATLPPSARPRAVQSTDPNPFRIFVLTENHWSWSKSVDVTIVRGAFTCSNQARAEGVDAYHAYIHSSHQERKRLKWDQAATDAYDKMLKSVLADKLAWEKATRAYGTSFSIDECLCYPRGAYFVQEVKEDSPPPKADEAAPKSAVSDSNSPSSRVARENSSDPRSVSARSEARESFSDRVARSASARSVGRESFADRKARSASARSTRDPELEPEPVPSVQVVHGADPEGPRAHGFVRRTYAVNPEEAGHEFYGGEYVRPRRKNDDFHTVSRNEFGSQSTRDEFRERSSRDGRAIHSNVRENFSTGEDVRVPRRTASMPRDTVEFSGMSRDKKDYCRDDDRGLGRNNNVSEDTFYRREDGRGSGRNAIPPVDHVYDRYERVDVGERHWDGSPAQDVRDDYFGRADGIGLRRIGSLREGTMDEFHRRDPRVHRRNTSLPEDVQDEFYARQNVGEFRGNGGWHEYTGEHDFYRREDDDYPIEDGSWTEEASDDIFSRGEFRPTAGSPEDTRDAFYHGEGRPYYAKDATVPEHMEDDRYRRQGIPISRSKLGRVHQSQAPGRNWKIPGTPD